MELAPLAAILGRDLAADAREAEAKAGRRSHSVWPQTFKKSRRPAP
jgi:hypothetical protein